MVFHRLPTSNVCRNLITINIDHWNVGKEKLFNTFGSSSCAFFLLWDRGPRELIISSFWVLESAPPWARQLRMEPIAIIPVWVRAGWKWKKTIDCLCMNTLFCKLYRDMAQNSVSYWPSVCLECRGKYQRHNQLIAHTGETRAIREGRLATESKQKSEEKGQKGSCSQGLWHIQPTISGLFLQRQSRWKPLVSQTSLKMVQNSLEMPLQPLSVCFLRTHLQLHLQREGTKCRLFDFIIVGTGSSVRSCASCGWRQTFCCARRLFSTCASSASTVTGPSRGLSATWSSERRSAPWWWLRWSGFCPWSSVSRP